MSFTGIAFTIQDALIKAGVDRDVIWTQDSGTVSVHDEERERFDLRVGRDEDRFVAYDMIGDRVIYRGRLDKAAEAVVAHIA